MIRFSVLPRFTTPLLALSLTAALSACPGEMTEDAGTDGGHEEHDVEEELCEHMAEGPADAVTAGADLAGAPDISTAHRRYDLALIDDGNNMFIGSASFAADEEGELIIAFNTDVPVAFFDGDGTSIAIEDTEIGSEACDEVGVIHTIDVEVGTVEFRFGPTDATEVQIVVEEGAHDHEEE